MACSTTRPTSRSTGTVADIHRYTGCQFAAFGLLENWFGPRIRALSEQRIYRTDERDVRRQASTASSLTLVSND